MTSLNVSATLDRERNTWAVRAILLVDGHTRETKYFGDYSRPWELERRAKMLAADWARERGWQFVPDSWKEQYRSPDSMHYILDVVSPAIVTEKYLNALHSLEGGRSSLVHCGLCSRLTDATLLVCWECYREHDFRMGAPGIHSSKQEQLERARKERLGLS